MAEGSTEFRKLAAIMFTDMVGYSAFIRDDEAVALALLEEHRRLVRAVLPRHQGREVKTMGDGFLIAFPSAVAAAECALEIQRSIRTRNAGAEPARRIRLRIGIHLGDVVEQVDAQGKVTDLLGDGVNVASRIEPLAGPGGICVSQAVADQLRNRSGVQLEFLGRVALKNIDKEVPVHRVVLPWPEPLAPPSAPAPPPPRRRRLFWLATLAVLLAALGLFWLPRARPAEKKRIAVLPFANHTPDGTNAHVAEGIAGEINRALAMISGFQVMAETSMRAYQNSGRTIRDIGRELDVDSIIEGSVQTDVGRVRVSVSLVEARTQLQILPLTYDFELKDSFRIQSEVARRVADVLKVRLSPGERERVDRPGTEDSRAADLYFRGRQAWKRRTPDDLQRAITYFEEAAAKDPRFARSYVGLADAYALLAVYREMLPTNAFPRAEAAIAKALALDDTLGEAHASRAFFLHRYAWRWEEAGREYELARALIPSDETIHHWHALFLSEQGRFALALERVQEAQQRAPFSAVLFSVKGWIHYLARDYDAAARDQQKAIELHQDFKTARTLLALTLLQQGRHERAIAILDEAARADREDRETALLAYAWAVAGDPARARKLLAGLLEAADRKHIWPYDMALVHVALGETERALDWLEAAGRERAIDLALLKVDCRLDSLRSQPRFVTLARQVGIP